LFIEWHDAFQSDALSQTIGTIALPVELKLTSCGKPPDA